jgi:aspartate/methionine/tyrosine aminotransferase
MAVDERMQALRATGRDIVSLGAGQLDFDTPAPVAHAGVEAITRGRTRYTPVAGTLSLRRAVRAKFELENGLVYGDDEVIVGAGAKSVIYHALLALVDPGDAVIVPSPAWPSYASMVELAGGRVQSATLAADDGYRLTAANLRAALAAAGGRGRGLILNSPHNPTGALLPAERIAELAAVVREAGLWVMSISQEAAEAALRLSVAGDSTLTAGRRRVRDALEARRDLACRALAAIAGITLVRPAGAFYVFADVSRHYGRTLAGRTITDSTDLAEHLLEHAGVAVVPGALFGDDRCLRVSFAASPEELTVALGRLADALA